MTPPGVEVCMPGAGPRFLGLNVEERNRRVAVRAAEHDHSLAGTLRFSDDSVVITQSLMNWLPREGSWTIQWHPARPPFIWEAIQANAMPQSVAAPKGDVLDVRTPGARRRSTWTLLLRSGKPTDGWLSRTIHRRVSRVLSYGLLGLRLRANDATLLTLGVGAVAAWYIAQTSHLTMIAGAFLFWFASIADGVDGEMARLRLSESARGEQLDTFADIATYVLCLIAVMVGWWRQGIGRADVILVATAGLGVPAAVFYGMHLVRRASGASQFFIDSKPMEKAIRTAATETGSPVLHLTAILWLLFRRESFSLLFFLGSLLTKWRGYGVAGLAVAALLALTTLIAYGGPIECALRNDVGNAGPARSPDRRSRLFSAG